MFDPAIEPQIWHVIVAAIVVAVLPLWTALVAVPRVRKLSADEQDQLRPRIYVEAMVLQWALALIALSPVLFRGAQLEQLGLVITPDKWPRVLMGGALAALLLAGFWWQRELLLTREAGRQVAHEALSGLAWLLPRGNRQRHLWVAVSAHAGIGEELFYRGFLLAALNWYLPFWAAALAATAIFGLGHMYQGVKGVIGTAAVGAVMLALYAFTGSLWVSILLHAVYDIQGGEFGRRVLYGRNATA
jgi:membrane protease YdiL (CAAX protease family)